METTQETKTALTPAEEVRQELAKQGMADAAIADMKKKYSDLTIVNLDDKDGYKKVYEARQEVKKARIGVEKFCKQKRDVFTAMNKAISAEEKRLTDELIALEDKLQAEEDKVKKWAEEKATERVNKMVAQLVELGFANIGTESMPVYSIPDFKIGVDVLKSLSEQEFEAFVEKAKVSIAEAARKAEEEAEAKRQEEKKLLEQRREQKITNRKVAAMDLGFYKDGENYKHPLAPAFSASFIEIAEDDKWADLINTAKEINRKEQERISAEQEKVRQEQEAEAKRLAEEKAKIESDKKAIEQQKQKARTERLQAIGMKYDGIEYTHPGITLPAGDVLKKTDHEFEEMLKGIVAEITRYNEYAARVAVRTDRMKAIGFTEEKIGFFIFIDGEKKYSTEHAYPFGLTDEQFDAFIDDCRSKIDAWKQEAQQKKEEAARKAEEEKKKREQEEIARQEALRPDKEKIIKFAEETFTIVNPQIEFTNDAARLLFNKYSLALRDTLRDLKSEAENL